MRFKDSIIIDDSKLGFRIAGDSIDTPSYTIQQTERKSIQNSWKPIYGECNEISDHYSEVLIKLKSIHDSQPDFSIRCRAYNEGVAFRYEYDELSSELVFEDELTEFSIPSGAKAWVSKRAQSEIYDLSVEQIDIEAERPLLLELKNKVFLSLGEANLVDFARMKFEMKENTTLKSVLSSPVKFDHPFTTPWRYIMAAASPGKLLENNYLK